jgi:SAM-dependent methyltransferase
MTEAALKRFGVEYARHRLDEGRACSEVEQLSLPYLKSGPLVRQWTVRARTFDAFRSQVLGPLASTLGRTLTLVDLGAGNGWLSYRATLDGHEAIAVDIRDDGVDGLGAAEVYMRCGARGLQPVVASFDTLPLDSASVDLAVFNASLHYAVDLSAALGEAVRVVRPGGLVIVMDSPFYSHESDGAAMIADKHAHAAERFGDRADALLALPFIEYLTRDRLHEASNGLGLEWRRKRVLYPLWYEMRPILAALSGNRRPSRFDLWIGQLR